MLSVLDGRTDPNFRKVSLLKSFVLYLKIFKITVLISFHLCKLHIGTGMLLTFLFQSWDGFDFPTSSNTEPLDTRDAAASLFELFTFYCYFISLNIEIIIGFISRFSN